MRKKVVALSLFCILIALSVGITCSGCALRIGVPENITDRFDNLAADAEFMRQDNEVEESALLQLQGKKKFNTIALSEKTDTIAAFELYIDGELVYANDRIGNFRYCALSRTFETDQVRIRVTKRDNENWSLHKPQVYMVEQTCADDFEVMSYIYTAKALQLDEEDKKIISATTQFNLFSSLYLSADGDVYFKPHTLADGREFSGEDAFRQAIANIRQFHPQASIVATILGSEDLFGDGLDQEARHDAAMTDSADKLIANVLKIIDDYGLDGIAFDYEYPHNLITNLHYGDFLKKLKLAMPQGKQLNCAFSLWNLTVFGTFPHSKLQYVDRIELMTYDGFDEYGDHSSFYTMCAEALAQLQSKGIDLAKVHLGLPFYSRPIDSGAFWGNYSDVCDQLGIYGNSLMQTIRIDGQEYEQLCYYNSRQLIFDKTSYAIDAGAGGVMIWHYGCDTKDDSLSLYGAIAQAIADRSAA